MHIKKIKQTSIYYKFFCMYFEGNKRKKGKFMFNTYIFFYYYNLMHSIFLKYVLLIYIGDLRMYLDCRDLVSSGQNLLLLQKDVLYHISLKWVKIYVASKDIDTIF